MTATGNLLSLILACAPGAAPSTVQAIIDVESKGNVLAIGINRGGRLTRQPANYAEAAAWAQWLLDNGKNFDAGLMQINSANWKRLGLTPQTVFDPCTNVRAGTKILTDNYVNASKSLGPGREALLAALSAYNTGNKTAGFSNGYVGKVNSAAAKRAGVAPPYVPSPPPRIAARRENTRGSTRRVSAPMGGVAPASAWRGEMSWGTTGRTVANNDSPSATKETAE
ncbi:lytic transglycosylase domain-containing protein [Xanthomonas campestris pv. campestris]|uniref:lytic transglycosylase domain-containing protein n=1 Tax=Xanthomonas campestris TaxID=339 RepID=UPI001E61854B|nr:lytic transglycosylase domain-containing protein [Xanthomonas campestris]MCD0253110.1 lytic transglycosylase domain-containing protein [Xanthomonas campestris pv. campestris]